MDSAPKARAWVTLFEVVRRFESDKLAPWMALRNAIGVVVPLVAGVAFHEISTALVAATGALVVSFSDGDDPYSQRAKRMLASSFIVGGAVFVGASFAHDHLTAIILATLWAFAAGMMVALSPAAGDIGVVSLVTLVVFSAQPMSLEKAAAAGAFALAGALIQTTLSLALWPVRRYEPERRTLSSFYRELSRMASSPVHASQPPPASQESIQAQAALKTLAGDHSIAGERYANLLHQAERIRLTILALRRVHSRMERDRTESPQTATLAEILEASATLLASVADSLYFSKPANPAPGCLQSLNRAIGNLSERDTGSFFGALVRDARFHTDALSGQLRAALELAEDASPEGREKFADREARQPWGLRIQSAVATIRANLSIHSSVFRHAIRLAACVAIGDALGRAMHWQRAYWVPMTIAIVLKPDFTATFSRGLLRLIGTFVGLVLATGLFYVLPAVPVTEVLLIGLFMYIIRWAGPANYGIFATAVTALVVTLFTLTGLAPGEVIVSRGWNSLVGGVICLLAYSLWPTWERHQIGETIARLLDAYRLYYRSVAQGYLAGASSNELGQTRVDSRLARSNLEAAVERTRSEPGFSDRQAQTLSAILASSHRFVHAVMALEAGLSRSRSAPAREAFRVFSNNVELSLYYLAAALRGSPFRQAELPDMRESHRQMLEAGDALTERYAMVNVETDRVTNSINTLSEYLFQWVGCKTSISNDKM